MPVQIRTLWNAINRWWWVAMLLLCLGMTIHTAQLIQGDSIKGDATQNLIIGLSLYEDGNFSLDTGTSEKKPTKFRDALPPFLTAVYLKALGPFVTPFTLESLHHGEHTRFVKLQNLLWVFLGLVGAWLLFNATARTKWAGGIAAYVVFIFHYNNGYTVNSLYTELHTGVLLIWLSICILKAIKGQRIGSWFSAGLILGLLSLTKAPFLYLAPPLIILLAIFEFLAADKAERLTHTVRITAALALGTALTVGPWMVRNQLQFGSPQLSQGRSGWVVYKRALLNDISDDEYRRGFTLWGPMIFKNLMTGTSMEVTEEDAKSWNGSLRRLFSGRSEFSANDQDAQAKGDPEQAVSLYRKTSAVYVKLERIFAEAGYADPDVAGDLVMQQVGLQRVMDNPMAHLKLTPLMFWRGMWCFTPLIDMPLIKNLETKRYVVEIVNLLSMLAIFYLFFAGLIQRNRGWIALAAPSMAMMAFYTLASQNLTRFFSPAQPLMLLALMLVIALLFRRKPHPAAKLVEGSGQR